jgi:hypothetical protein
MRLTPERERAVVESGLWRNQMPPTVWGCAGCSAVSDAQRVVGFFDGDTFRRAEVFPERPARLRAPRPQD